MSAPWEASLWQQGSQSLKHTTMKTKWPAAPLECYEWQNKNNETNDTANHWTVVNYMEIILCNYLCYKILIILHSFYVFIANVTLSNYVLSFFKMRYIILQIQFMWSRSTVQNSVHTVRDTLLHSVLQARIIPSQ